MKNTAKRKNDIIQQIEWRNTTRNMTRNTTRNTTRNITVGIKGKRMRGLFIFLYVLLENPTKKEWIFASDQIVLLVIMHYFNLDIFALTIFFGTAGPNMQNNFDIPLAIKI